MSLGTSPRRGDPTPPTAPDCAACGVALGEPYGWCGNCRAAYCLACGRAHFCTPGCPAQGCHVGLCVRLVRGGELAAVWGLPAEGSG